MTSTGDGKHAKETPAQSIRDCFTDSKEPHEKRHYRAEGETLDAAKAQGRRHCRAEGHDESKMKDESKHHEKRHFTTADHKFEDTHARIF
ncbi:hypothetical protein PRIPAC_81165 [Pristionchus pacificus]|uniref:Uncharacterized protein n=1 Tax=Pristionchus pacificus TaxID=54126 RepID=A0A2A6CQI8_PRIPA|nr:hypothetical protein PRIPAC_81165 [Pristionchus pacificus]|eukprot:PDM80303.1 hypothetical protein PRIPAC_32882 [Pristionchus pacificus]